MTTDPSAEPAPAVPPRPEPPGEPPESAAAPHIASPPEAPAVVAPPAAGYAIPPAGYAAPPAGYHAQSYPYGYQVTPPTNGMAIAALAASSALVLSCMPLAIIGAILGHIARRQIRERGESGDGLALAGIIIGWIGFALPVFVIAALLALRFGSSPTD